MKRLIVVILIILICIGAWLLIRGKAAPAGDASPEVRFDKGSASETHGVESTKAVNLSNELLAVGHPAVLKAGGSEFGLAFQNAAISDELKNFISHDLQNTYGHLNSFVLGKPTQINQKIIVAGIEMPVVGSVNFDGKGRYGADAQTEFGLMVNIDGSKCLVVSQRLEDAYYASYKFVIDNQPVFNKLGEFIEKLNTIRASPPASIADVVYAPDQAGKKQLARTNLDELVKVFGGKHYRMGSVLSMATNDKQPGVFLFPLYIVEPDGISLGTPVGYHEGEWKLQLLGGE